MSPDYNKLALKYHSEPVPGKISVIPTKPAVTQMDLALAYTPGVAAPCLEIQKNPEDAYKYTSRGNLVAVITNGTAVLGLGNIGALAGKPVMEGKSLLFKRFADVDAVDIELNTENIEDIIRTVKLMEPTFGGVNLEDIKAPECFEIEQRLIEMCDIPIFHDDQHGTAIISAAGLLNACELSGRKDLSKVRVVISGAGAAAISCARLYCRFGIKRENIIMCDSKGVISTKRTDINEQKRGFAVETDCTTLAEAMVGADIFLGLSKGNTVSKDMVKTMAPNPVIFAMANPIPEISYEDAKSARPDAYMATGRSDYPNQINNVLGFPFIFRGALDVRASRITEEMKEAAARALAALAHEPVPADVLAAYNIDSLEFGMDYLIPKPFDKRVLLWEAPAVAQAAMICGVARKVVDMDEYKKELEERLKAMNE